MAKTRKPQSEEEYQAQKTSFYQDGPRLNTENWLKETVENSSDSLTSTAKSDRVVLLQACEKAYYRRDYGGCLELVARAEQVLEIELGSDLDEIVDEENAKSVKKTAKLERHVVELAKIKQRCLQKVNES